MQNAYKNWIKNGQLVIGILIVCLAMLCNAKSTRSTTDSLRKLEPRTILLTETGARQVLKDKADLIMLYGVVSSQDTLLTQQQRAILTLNQSVQQLNQRQQQATDQSRDARSLAEQYRKKLRAARWENWLIRGGAVIYVVLKFRLISATGNAPENKGTNIPMWPGLLVPWKLDTGISVRRATTSSA